MRGRRNIAVATTPEQPSKKKAIRLEDVDEHSKSGKSSKLMRETMRILKADKECKAASLADALLDSAPLSSQATQAAASTPVPPDADDDAMPETQLDLDPSVEPQDSTGPVQESGAEALGDASPAAGADVPLALPMARGVPIQLGPLGNADAALDLVTNRMIQCMSAQISPVIAQLGDLHGAACTLASLQQSLGCKLEQFTNEQRFKVGSIEESLSSLRAESRANTSGFSGRLEELSSQLSGLRARLDEQQQQQLQQQQQQQQLLQQACSSSVSPGTEEYATTAFVGGWPRHTPQKAMFTIVQGMIDHANVRHGLTDLWAKRFSTGCNVKFVTVELMWRFINSIPLSMKEYKHPKTGVCYKIWLNKSNVNRERTRRVNTRRISKALSRRFGVPESDVYVDAGTHCIYILELPVVEVHEGGDIEIYEESIRDIWEQTGAKGALPSPTEVGYMACKAGLTENMDEDAQRLALLMAGGSTDAVGDEAMTEKELDSKIAELGTKAEDPGDDFAAVGSVGLLDVHADSAMRAEDEDHDAMDGFSAAELRAAMQRSMRQEDEPSHPEASSSSAPAPAR